MAKEIDITQRNNITIGDIKENSKDTPDLNDGDLSITSDAFNQDLTYDSGQELPDRENIPPSLKINGGRKGEEIDTNDSEAVHEDYPDLKNRENLEQGYYYTSVDFPNGFKQATEIDTYGSDAGKVQSEAILNDTFAAEGEKQTYKKLEEEIGPGIERLRGKINKNYKDNLFGDVFLRNIFPIIGTSLYKNIESMAQGDWSTATGMMSTLHTIMNLVMQVKYLRPAEMVLFLGSNFYTLHFIRGITAKKFTGFFGTSWNGFPDLTFGRNYADLLPSISEILSNIADAVRPPEVPYPKGDNAEISSAKERISPIFNISAPYEEITVKRQQYGTDPLSPGNMRITYPQADVGKTSYKDLRKDSNEGKWKKDSGTNRDFVEAEKDEVKRNKLTTDAESYRVNDKVINILLPKDEGNGPNPVKADSEEGGISDLKDYRPNDTSIGFILVIPQTQETERFPRYRIPFEFNPEISPGGVSTNYNAQQVLARIGSLQTFSNVELSTVDITTEYFATADNLDEGKESGSKGNEWMSKYTLKLLQGIQKGYEALSYPFFPSSEEQNIEKGFKYMKPPLVKVVIGEANADEETPYSNLLTYPKNVAGSDNILKSTTEKRLYKTFIVTSVSIEKDLKETPVYIENKKLKDTFGFSVNLSLTEVTKNYMDVMPNYENYFKQFDNMIDDSRVIVD